MKKIKHKKNNNLNINDFQIQNNDTKGEEINFEDYEEQILKKFEVTGIEIFLNFFHEIDIQVWKIIKIIYFFKSNFNERFKLHSRYYTMNNFLFIQEFDE